MNNRSTKITIRGDKCIGHGNAVNIENQYSMHVYGNTDYLLCDRTHLTDIFHWQRFVTHRLDYINLNSKL